MLLLVLDDDVVVFDFEVADEVEVVVVLVAGKGSLALISLGPVESAPDAVVELCVMIDRVVVADLEVVVAEVEVEVEVECDELDVRLAELLVERGELVVEREELEVVVAELDVVLTGAHDSTSETTLTCPGTLTRANRAPGGTSTTNEVRLPRASPTVTVMTQALPSTVVVALVDPGVQDSLWETGTWDPGTVTPDGLVPGGSTMPSTSVIPLSRLRTIEHWSAEAAGIEPSPLSPRIAATTTAARFAQPSRCR